MTSGRSFDSKDSHVVLRREAELLLGVFTKSSSMQRETDDKALLHELQVHQIELEMQNEALVTAQAERQAIVDRYTNLFDFAPIGYVNLSVSGQVLLSNLAFATMVGLPRANLIDRRFGLFVATPDRAAFSDFLAAVFASGEKKVCELQLELEHGKPLFVRLEAICSANGSECLVAVIDVTERKSAEESLRQSQKMEAIGQLAGGIAHDFNNILTVIDGYAGQMLKETPHEDVRYEPLVEICSASAHAAYLTRQLLAFSQRQMLRPETIDLNVMVMENNAMLKRLIGDSVALEVSLDPDLHCVWAERGQISQILLNLVINARDALDGGGNIAIRTSNVELKAVTFRNGPVIEPGGYALLTVSDTGSGMSKEVQSRIFEPFFTTKPDGKGTGIGLATVHSVVARAGGQIEVWSEEGKGTIFKVYLPQLRKRNETLSSSPRTPVNAERMEFQGGNQSILLVEDDDSVRQLANTILSDAGYVVLIASDGVGALRIAQDLEQKIDLLLTDVAMRGMDGSQLAELVRGLRPGIPVLKMSGYISKPETIQPVVREKVEFIQKPFSPGQLVLKVMSMFSSDTATHF